MALLTPASPTSGLSNGERMFLLFKALSLWNVAVAILRSEHLLLMGGGRPTQVLSAPTWGLWEWAHQSLPEGGKRAAIRTAVDSVNAERPCPANSLSWMPPYMLPADSGNHAGMWGPAPVLLAFCCPSCHGQNDYCHHFLAGIQTIHQCPVLPTEREHQSTSLMWANLTVRDDQRYLESSPFSLPRWQDYSLWHCASQAFYSRLSWCLQDCFSLKEASQAISRWQPLSPIPWIFHVISCPTTSTLCLWLKAGVCGCCIPAPEPAVAARHDPHPATWGTCNRTGIHIAGGYSAPQPHIISGKKIHLF